jgi:predicted PurR-regulated permease PerM
VKLFPKSQHPRVEDAMDAVGNGLTLWFYAQLISMVIVGGLSMLAYWYIGLPGALALGVIAGLTNFIPLLGPVIGAIPAVLISFTAEGNALLWTLAAALVIQQIEGNIIMPIVEKRAVQLPPALALFAILAAGLVFGFLGVFLAVPITVVAFILVKKLYVRQTLGESTPVPGEEERGPSVDEARIAGLKG